MAFDAFMWLEGGSPAVKGETNDSKMKGNGAFELHSFSWGAQNPVTVGSHAGGIGAGRVQLSSFNITKRTDTASPTLFQNCCKGSHFNKAHVVLRKAGGPAPVEYIKYDFEQVYVDSIQWSGSNGGDDAPAESVSFTFGKCEIIYTPQTAKGSAGAPVTAAYDIITNKA